MRFTPILDGLEARHLATILPVGIVAIVPIDGGTDKAPPPTDRARGPRMTIIGLPAPNPLPDFNVGSPPRGANPE